MEWSSDIMKLKSSSCLTPLVLSSRGNFSWLANKLHPCLEKTTTKGKPLLAGFPDTSAWSWAALWWPRSSFFKSGAAVRAAGFDSDGRDSISQQPPLSWPDALALQRVSVTVKVDSWLWPWISRYARARFASPVFGQPSASRFGQLVLDQAFKTLNPKCQEWIFDPLVLQSQIWMEASEMTVNMRKSL